MGQFVPPPRMFCPLPSGTNALDVIAFDTEDNGQGAPDNFILACFYSEKDGPKWFSDRAAARQYIFKERRNNVAFFAHNLAYDIANVDYPENWASLMPREWGGLIGAKYKTPAGRRYIFGDTGNFYVRATIKQLGAKLGQGEEKLDYDPRRLRGKHWEDFDMAEQCEIRDYCMQDAKICYLAAQRIISMSHSLGVKFKSFTVASMAMRIFRTKFLKHSIKPRGQAINDIERLSYYGGRTEVFDTRQFADIFYEDINSSYPTAMKYKPFPMPDRFERLRWQNVDAGIQAIHNEEGISLVTVNVPQMHIPPLPYRRVQDGSTKLLFPVGSWTAVYTHPELRMATKAGVRIGAVHESIIYREKVDLFSGFVDYFHKAKSQSTGIDRDLNKLIMNGLSGKFGERRRKVSRGLMTNLEPKDIANANIGEADANGWVNVIGERMPDSVHTFPVLIAYICAYGRIKLYEERLAACQALYCDTDSAISPDSPCTFTGTMLGNWDVKRYTYFQAFAPKDYALKAEDGVMKKKLKGVPARAVMKLDPEDGKMKWHYERPLKMSEAMRRHKRPNEWVEVKKENARHFDKRILHKNGTTEPLFINEPDYKATFESELKRLEQYLI